MNADEILSIVLIGGLVVLVLASVIGFGLDRHDAGRRLGRRRHRTASDPSVGEKPHNPA